MAPATRKNNMLPLAQAALGDIDRAFRNLQWAIEAYDLTPDSPPLPNRMRRDLVVSVATLKGIHTRLKNSLASIREVAPTEIIPTEEASPCPVPSLREAQP